MAKANILLNQDQFCCPVCLDLLKHPVTIPCGHNYCMSCISEYWNQKDQKGIYRCALCKQSFTPRLILGKNVVIAGMLEKLKKMKLQTVAPAVHHTESGDVQCNSCTEIKQKAVKSCLECRSSYCQNHLEQHENLFRGKQHNLMDPTRHLQDMICPQHDKMLDIYCRTDQRCICMLCLGDGHKNHDTVSTAEARAEKQRYLVKKQRKIQKIIQQKEKDLQELREAVASHKRSTQTAMEDSERIFTELIRSIEKRRSEVMQLIRDQERAAVSRAEERLERMQLELDELRRKDVELKQLSETDDHIHFFQRLPSVPGLTGLAVSCHLSFDAVVKTMIQLRDNLHNFSRETIENITGIVKTIQVFGAPDYQTRKDFLRYSHQLTPELNSVNNWIHLSERNTVMTDTDKDQCYPDHPDRFDYWTQVLCRESVTGRCYWEVEWRGDERLGVAIAVTYKSIRRKGESNEILAGCNNQSWRLYCTPTFYSFTHNNIETVLPVTRVSSRIGVYVDHSAGILSFYSVSDSMSLIHRVKTTFTQPLYAMFGFDGQTSVKLCCLTK
ncbi:E3 ubiquitin/ISG15 ligase TRIM25-like [Garra rufa]|uniref:E3 ubiquitin/ISG15 ligase TRIM25-like n=1 Tax=Garra rufa TaxID=137080 RepID=UPI003CCEEA07